MPNHAASIQLCVQKLRILIEDSDQNRKYFYKFMLVLWYAGDTSAVYLNVNDTSAPSGLRHVLTNLVFGTLQITTLKYFLIFLNS